MEDQTAGVGAPTQTATYPFRYYHAPRPPGLIWYVSREYLWFLTCRRLETQEKAVVPSMPFRLTHRTMGVKWR